MKLIIGLGNPGTKYDNTRHNIGFMFIDYMAAAYHTNFSSKDNYKSATITIGGEKVILLKPQTFMNLSGEAVQNIMNFYKLKPNNILVIYDDLDIEFGKLRIKDNSSSGGHNGIKNIISHLHTQQFMRIKIGINSPHKKDVKTFVLSKFNKQELQMTTDIFNKVLAATEQFIITQDIEAMRTKLIN